MKTITLLVALFGLLMAPVAPSFGAAEYKIATGSEKGTYIQIGRDLAKWVAAPSDINLEVLVTKGSAENVQRLRYEPGVKFALVQSDVYQAFLDQAASGNRQAGEIIKPLRVIMPLYDEEIYFVVRADSPLNYIHEIKGKKINVGAIGSGTALSSTTLYRLMFGEALPDANATYLSNEDALVKLTTDTSIDVAIIVAGQPAKLFVDMKPEARQYIKFLKLDPKAPESVKATKTYFPATIRTTSYPNWLTEDVPTLTVKAFLVTYDYNLQMTRRNLSLFAEALCLNFKNLQNEGHAKWKQVNMSLPPLGRGWSYYPPIERELRSCRGQQPAPKSAPAPQQAAPCTQNQKVLGLCTE